MEKLFPLLQVGFDVDERWNVVATFFQMIPPRVIWNFYISARDVFHSK